MNSYQSIACGLHSQYELAIMHKQKITLRWQDATDHTYNETLHPLDLIAESGEEFLIARSDDGMQHKIRLDRILSHSL